MSTSNIEWTDATPNPIVGCTKISAGCKNCYAIKMAWRLMHSPHKAIAEKYAGTVEKTAGGELNWTGRINFDDQAMRKVIKNKKPTKYFVNSMGDLFHPNVPFHQIDLVFAAMGIAYWHTFQVLTKHPDRAIQWFNYKDPSWKNEGMRENERIRFQAYHTYGKDIRANDWIWPLKNVWIGTSTENQETANLRIPQLLQIPAAVHFLSCEPLLGPINLNSAIKDPKSIDWVIVGGESGPRSRPMHPDWVRSLRNQCQDADIPFFFKQFGAFIPGVDVFVSLGMHDHYIVLNNGDYAPYHSSTLSDEYGPMWMNMEPVVMQRTSKHNSNYPIDEKIYQEFPAIKNHKYDKK